MKIKKLLYLMFLSLMTVTVSACSVDNDEPSKITLPKDQPKEVSYAAGASSGNVRFTAAAGWSAHVSLTSRATGEVEWITLNDTHGEAGEVYLDFALERNSSGKSRTAYIIVLCEDQSRTFKITQRADDDDPDEPVPGVDVSGTIDIRNVRYMDGSNGMEVDGDVYYEIHYLDGRPREMICVYRDDLDGMGDEYCDTQETTLFSYEEASGFVRAEIQTVRTYYPSKRTEYEESRHELHYIIGDDRYPLALSGSYIYLEEDSNATKFEFAYNPEGYLSTSRNDDGEEGKWDTSSFAWSAGNLKSITGGYGSMDFEYTDTSLKNGIRCFDLNWALLNDFEVLDFAAGDITKIWAVCGFLGKSSANLATSATETDRYGIRRSSRMTYRTHTAEKTEVRVERFTDNYPDGYTDWEIIYSGYLR